MPRVKLTHEESGALVAFLLSIRLNVHGPPASDTVLVLSPKLKPLAERISKAWTGRAVTLTSEQGKDLLLLLATVPARFERRADGWRFCRLMDGVFAKLRAAGWKVQQPAPGVPMIALLAPRGPQLARPPPPRPVPLSLRKRRMTTH